MASIENEVSRLVSGELLLLTVINISCHRMHHQRKCLTKRGRMQRKRRHSLSAPAVMRTPEKRNGSNGLMSR